MDHLHTDKFNLKGIYVTNICIGMKLCVLNSYKCLKKYKLQMYF